MCGIVGILGQDPVAWKLVDALKRLEYRGYDSAGIAVLDGGDIKRVRAPGKLEALADKLRDNAPSSTTGIGHTRWATHGAPVEKNAHPHVGGAVAIVHNGIIENYKELKDELAAAGAKFETETDRDILEACLTALGPVACRR